jgi:DNA repair protein RadC
MAGKDLSDASAGLFPASPAEDKPDYLGHRKRLRTRFLSSGPDSLQDYELLELVLFGEALSASPEDLQQVDGLGEAAAVTLKTGQAAAQRLLETKVKAREAISSWNDLIAYCTAQMVYSENGA